MEGEETKKNHKNQRHTSFVYWENCKNTKLEAIKYTQKTWCRLMPALCMLFLGL